MPFLRNQFIEVAHGMHATTKKFPLKKTFVLREEWVVILQVHSYPKFYTDVIRIVRIFV